MARWGTGWGLGFPWGLSSGPNVDLFCDIAEDRVLVQMDDGSNGPGSVRKFRELVCGMVEGLGSYVDVLEDIQAAFDIETAIGEQLDFLGRMVGLQRQGFDDDRFRTFIKIQTDLILSVNQEDGNWTGTHANILKICRTFIGTAVLDPIILKNLPPYSYKLTVPGVSLDEMRILANFLCLATWAGVLGQATFTLGDDSLWNSPQVAITNGGIWNSAQVAIANGGVWGTTITIGTQNCE